MLLASGLGFAKLLTLAYLMPASDYGVYVSLFGAASLAGVLLSLGVTERSIKAYPRWWVQGQRQIIRHDAIVAMRTIGTRLVILGLCAAVLAGGKLGLFQIAGVAGLGLVTAFLAQLASMYRAVGSAGALQRFTMARGAAVFALALLGGWEWGWRGALAGDTLAGLLIAVWAWQDLRGLFAAAPVETGMLAVDEDVPVASGQGRLYLANLLSASTVMLDRAAVGAALGGAGAGTYGVVMLLPQMAQLLVNVVVQRIGPRAIKSVHLGQISQDGIRVLNRRTVMLATFVLGLVLAAWVAKQLPYLESFFLKYAVSDLALLLAGALGAGQIFSVIEFDLIAHDRESDILVAAATAAFLFCLLFAAVAYWGGGVEGFVAAAAIARWWQVLWLRRAYGRCSA